MLLAVLNTSIITTDGDYTLRTVPLDEARALVADADGLDSAVGHEATAQIITTLLGVKVPMNRQFFAQAVGQKALVFKLNGRGAEGQILSADQIQAIGYTFKVMTRTA